VAGNWPSALALFVYAAGFSFAYVGLSAGTGALLLFGAVQVTMITFALLSGEHLNQRQVIGITIALAGLVALLLPGLEAPPLQQAFFMLLAGAAWGVYSLRGRGVGDPTEETAGNFLRSLPFTAVISIMLLSHLHLDIVGVAYAVASGALASGLGYALWYAVLPRLGATMAATVQLSVPALAALAGVMLLDEPLTLRLALASVVILGGITVFILAKSDKTTPR
jgi:drug/metabolite transporter (DMT)-like permease